MKETKEKIDEEYFLKKEWSAYITQQREAHMKQILRALKSQELALKELKRDNINLYNAAIQVRNLFPVFFFL